MKNLRTVIGLILMVYGGCCTAQTPKENMNNKNNPSVEIIRYTIPAGQQAAFEAAYREAGEFLQASPYCLGYHLLHGEDEPEHYIVTIRWTSTGDHLNAFRKSRQFQDFFSLVRPFYNYIDEMKHYRETAVSWKKELTKK